MSSFPHAQQQKMKNSNSPCQPGFEYFPIEIFLPKITFILAPALIKSALCGRAISLPFTNTGITGTLPPIESIATPPFPAPSLPSRRTVAVITNSIIAGQCAPREPKRPASSITGSRDFHCSRAARIQFTVKQLFRCQRASGHGVMRCLHFTIMSKTKVKSWQGQPASWCPPAPAAIHSCP